MKEEEKVIKSKDIGKIAYAIEEGKKKGISPAKVAIIMQIKKLISGKK